MAMNDNVNSSLPCRDGVCPLGYSTLMVRESQCQRLCGHRVDVRFVSDQEALRRQFEECEVSTDEVS